MTDLALETDPEADPSFRCSPWTKAQGVDPVGSAGTFDQLLLVEWPLPWPADVTEVPALAEAAADGRARLMLVVPRADESQPDGLVRVVHRRRVSTHHMAGVDHRVEHQAVPALLADLLDAPDGDHLDWPSAVGASPPEVLVCGHGRRDPCCGRWGTLLHVELAARRTNVRVWRCSHTGGHRFAPTAITLPDGRAWAYVDADLIEGVLDRTADLSALAGHDRGCLALVPWAQAVERAVFGRVGWAWLDHEVTEVTIDATDDNKARVRLGWRAPDGARGRADADVEVTRTVPVLVCGQPPAVATKTSPEYTVRRLELAR